jgi:hypothetical protein
MVCYRQVLRTVALRIITEDPLRDSLPIAETLTRSADEGDTMPGITRK